MPVRSAYLSLGSNLGNRDENLERGLEALQYKDIRVIAKSSQYETEPQDVIEQPWFLNMVVECETRCFPLQLLGVLQSIERELGRVRAGAVRRGPRVIDIDILLFGNAVLDTPRLTIPHPRLLKRRFVLEPLLEIAPYLKHPETREPLSKFLVQVAAQKIRKTKPQA